MAHKWGYDPENGPDTWSKHFEAARGDCQSPINIVTANVVHDTKMAETPLKMKYEPETDICLSNTGHSMKVDTSADSILTGGPLGNNVYKLAQFHMHWGSDDSKGAEHTINNKVYSAELHMVHWNSTNYKSFAEAANKKDGLAVLCMFVKVGQPHKGFQAVADLLCHCECKEAKCSVASFDPSCLLPENTTRYWTYPGSLTTPPCYESVQFILFEEVLEFSPEQLQALRSLRFGKDKGSKCMVDNFRPPCYIGTRKVRATFPQK